MQSCRCFYRRREESKDEIGKIGSQLYALYSGKAENLEKQKKREEENRVETENTKKEVEKEFGENEQKIRKLGVDIGALTSRVKSFDEVEDTFNREFSADLRRNIVGLYVDGALEIFRKERKQGFRKRKMNRQNMPENFSSRNRHKKDFPGK